MAIEGLMNWSRIQGEPIAVVNRDSQRSHAFRTKLRVSVALAEDGHTPLGGTPVTDRRYGAGD